MKFYQVLYLPFFSKQFYQQVIKLKPSRPFLYLLFFLAVCWVPVTAAIAIRSAHMLDNLAAQFPVITIKDGVASTPLPRPYFIYDDHNRNLVAIVDTAEQYKSFKDSAAMLLVGAHGTLYKNGSQLVNKPFAKSTNMVMGPQQIKQKILHTTSPVGLVVYLLALSLSYLACLVWGFVYGIVAQLISKIFGRDLNYSQAFGLSLIALIPGAGLFLLLLLFNVLFHFEWLLILLIQLFYIIYAVGSLPQKKGKI